jgi:hypothetical protein
MCAESYIRYKEVYTFARPRTRKEAPDRPSKLVRRFLRRTGKALSPTGPERTRPERIDTRRK